ncbi:MAG: signal recognition particle-docking protein FtsY [Ignavibacteriales bacterium]|nr:signal recognition particle-docking protein FtsY [Ignavibacteriales bacterium]
MGFFDKMKLGRLKEGLTKTREALVTKVTRLITARARVDAEFLEQLEEILIGADVGVAMAQKILGVVQEKAKKERYENTEELNALVREAVGSALTGSVNSNGDDPFALPEGSKPHVMMVVGVNGVGKTTTIGKLAYNYKTAGKNVFIGAADTFRAAANEQLEIWAKRAGVTIIQQSHGSDPAAVAFDTLKSAKARNADVVIIDTAGRLHTKVNLMEELKKIKRVMDKAMPGAPHEVLLVLDASTGQNAIQQARQFDAAIGLTGLVITKLDGTAKGGIVLSISQALKIPVRFIGVGEQIDDLQPFIVDEFVKALFEKGQ